MPNHTTMLARQFYLYGDGDGKPITDIRKLAIKVGAAPETLYRYVNKWNKEREDIVSSTAEFGLSLQVAAEDLAKCQRDRAFFRSQVDEITEELTSGAKILQILRSFLSESRRFSSTEDYQAGLQALNSYVQLYATRKSLRGQLALIQKRWTELAGISSAVVVAETSAKTMAAGKARLEIERRKRELDNPDNSPRPVGGGFFDVSSTTVQSEDSDDDEGLG